MRYREIINELFDANTAYEVTKETSEIFATKATIGGRTIMFSAENYGMDENGREAWEVAFMEKSDKYPSGTFGLSGNGNEIAVMNMIKRSLEEFVNRYQPDSIKFTADQNTWNGERTNSRAKLYARMVKKFAPAEYEAIVEPESHTTFFTLVRKSMNEDQQLDELFTSEVPMSVSQYDNMWDATSVIGNRVIKFTARKLYRNKNIWEASFVEISKNYPGGTHAATGSGNEMEVLSMVQRAILKFATEMQPDEMRFRAERESMEKRNVRASVYEKMIKRALPPGYSLETERDGIGTDFVIYKDDVMEGQINELFANQTPIKVVRQNHSRYEAEAKVAGRLLVFMAVKNQHYDVWDVSFHDDDEPGMLQGYGMTGKGGSVEVLTFAKTCMSDFLEKYDYPMSIKFTARKDGARGARPDVYEKMAKRMMPSYYNVRRFDDMNDASFVLYNTTKQPPEDE